MDLHRDTIALSFDVEWASQEAIDDVRTLLDERGLHGTFFVTHSGVLVPGHERGLHPNFRRNGETYRLLAQAEQRTDDEVHEHVIATTIGFAPEAKGVRAHSLYFDSALLPLYERRGIEYDSSLRLELVAGLRPFWKQHGIVEIPTYYADYFDLVTQATGFDLGSLHLDQPGMKVFDFHPNLIFTNAPTQEAYAATKPFNNDAERLLAARFSGRGTRTLFVALLNYIVALEIKTATLGEINAVVRTAPPNWLAAPRS